MRTGTSPQRTGRTGAQVICAHTGDMCAHAGSAFLPRMGARDPCARAIRALQAFTRAHTRAFLVCTRALIGRLPALF